VDIIVTGTRGIPNVQGGVETHCQELYPLIVASGKYKVTLIGRSAYMHNNKNLMHYKGVLIRTIYSPRLKSLEAIVHTFLAVIYAAIKRPDVLHIHAIGPNLLTPMARLFGLNVVMTHHGPDYQRKKWGKLAKFFLKWGERCGVRWANKVIVISDEIGEHIESLYGRKDYCVIPNGVPKPNLVDSTTYLDKFGLKKQKYIFTLGRFVPEKGFDYLIEAYLESGLQQEYSLVIAGDADHETDYSRKLKNQAAENHIVLTGFVKEKPLLELFTHARLFVLPSYYEGLPIALLEAMSYQLDIVASDIPANLQVGLPVNSYFKTGDKLRLKELLTAKLNKPIIQQDYNLDKYNWNTIAGQTMHVYSTLIN